MVHAIISADLIYCGVVIVTFTLMTDFARIAMPHVSENENEPKNKCHKTKEEISDFPQMHNLIEK